MKKKVILDVDTGTDDAIAIMMAVLSQSLEVLGITTVDGNTKIDYCTENTLRVLDLLGANIPVYEGCQDPIIATLFPGRRLPERHSIPNPIHGRLLDLNKGNSSVQEKHAVFWLIETILSSEADITIIALAPLTNIAMALRIEPKIKEKITEIVIMGGGWQISNVTPVAEFNFWADPEAVKIVLHSNIRITMIPLDATHQAQVTIDGCHAITQSTDKVGKKATEIIEMRMNRHQIHHPDSKRDRVPIHDALAVCAVIDEEIIKTKFIHVDIETGNLLTDGQSVCDIFGRTRKPPNVHFAYQADEEKFRNMVITTFRR